MNLAQDMAVEDIRRLAQGLQSLSHLLEIAGNTSEQISLAHLASLIGMLALATNCKADHIFEILRTQE